MLALRRFVVLPGTLVLLTLAAWAQTTAIKGTVEDQDRRPLGSVPLTIERQDLRGVFRARSGANGSLFYAGLPLGVFRVFCDADPDSAVEVRTQTGDPAIVQLTCYVGGARRPDRSDQFGGGGRDDQYRGSGRGVLDRVRADLDRIAADAGSFAPDEMRRFNRVRDRIAEFQSAWADRRFDQRILDEVIDSLNAIIDRSRLRARDRDLLTDDVSRLKGIRDRRESPADGAGAPAQVMAAAFNDGLAAEKAGDHRGAIAAFRRALAIDANQDAIWANLSAAYTGAGSFPQAEEALAKAVQLKPENGAYRNNYALALAKTGKLEEAWIQLEEAARIEPANAGHYFYNLGAILINSDHAPEAGRAFRRSIQADPNYADSHYQYGVWLMTEAKVGADGRVRAPRALAEFESYLRLEPNGKNAQSARTMLQTLGR
jgi:tetratricopeptide (TPR) repeat protein